MNGEPEVISFRCPPGLHWVKDADQVIVVTEGQSTPAILTGVEAIVWEWLILEYPYSKLLKLTAGLLAVTSEEIAAGQLGQIMRHWQTLGLLEVSEAING